MYRPARVDEDFVLRKCDYFEKVGLWGARSGIRPKAWLGNFSGEEREFAVSLLNAFLYFGDDLMLELLRGAFQGLSRTRFAGRPNRVEVWREFASRVVFTPLQADGDTPAESGVHWVNRWRGDQQLPSERILWPEDALEALLEDPTLPVVFVDDFVGSGLQMRKMWSKKIPILSQGVNCSFEELAAEDEATLIYAPALCTSEGMRRLGEHCPDLYVNPGNEITDMHNALAEGSLIWPEEHKDGAREFVAAASARAGIDEEGWEGFEGLGLAVGFGQSVPDATLPLIYWEGNGWTPLIKRT